MAWIKLLKRLVKDNDCDVLESESVVWECLYELSTINFTPFHYVMTHVIDIFSLVEEKPAIMETFLALAEASFTKPFASGIAYDFIPENSDTFYYNHHFRHCMFLLCDLVLLDNNVERFVRIYTKYEQNLFNLFSENDSDLFVYLLKTLQVHIHLENVEFKEFKVVSPIAQFHSFLQTMSFNHTELLDCLIGTEDTRFLNYLLQFLKYLVYYYERNNLIPQDAYFKIERSNVLHSLCTVIESSYKSNTFPYNPTALLKWLKRSL
jgi:hypothetical protein